MVAVPLAFVAHSVVPCQRRRAFLRPMASVHVPGRVCARAPVRVCTQSFVAAGVIISVWACWESTGRGGPWGGTTKM